MRKQEGIISERREGSSILGGKSRGERGKQRREDEISNGSERDFEDGAVCGPEAEALVDIQ